MSRIHKIFLAVYAMLAGVLAVGSAAIVKEAQSAVVFYEIGVWAGRAAVILLAIVLLPGIFARFGVRAGATRLVVVYRRQLGIVTFILSFTHGMLVRIVARIGLGRYPLERAPVFELFGTLAISLLFFLFVTSNNGSVRRLGPWWKRLHRLVYVIVWLVLFHTVLQRVSIWSVTIGVVAILELASLLWSSRLGRGRRVGT